jgi:hypothetical protein
MVAMCPYLFGNVSPLSASIHISQYAQSSIVGATAAFMGGTYVSLRFHHTRDIGSHAAVTYPREICQRTNLEDPRIGKVTK